MHDQDIGPFDRTLRRWRRQRAAAAAVPGVDFLRAHMIEELLFRLGAVQRRFTRVLDLGCIGADLNAAVGDARIVSADASFHMARAARGVQCDEDRLPFADGSFDLAISAGVLHSVNDLPGALSLIRRALRPDSLFLAAFVGGETLSKLRAAFLAAEAARGSVSPRVAPMVEVRAAGDLLSRAGFTLPVADSERLRLRYGNLFSLCTDLRAAGETNILMERSRHFLCRDILGDAAAHFAQGADADGKVSEVVDIIYLTGWSPGPDQPRPLKPGSAKASLAEALREIDKEGRPQS